MPAEDTPRQKKQASKPVSRASMVDRSSRCRCTISRSLVCVCPVALRPTESTVCTRGSSRHSRRTPCPTMPVAPNRITFMRVGKSTAEVGGGQEMTRERYLSATACAVAVIVGGWLSCLVLDAYEPQRAERPAGPAALPPRQRVEDPAAFGHVRRV